MGLANEPSYKFGHKNKLVQLGADIKSGNPTQKLSYLIQGSVIYNESSYSPNSFMKISLTKGQTEMNNLSTTSTKMFGNSISI